MEPPRALLDGERGDRVGGEPVDGCRREWYLGQEGGGRLATKQRAEPSWVIRPRSRFSQTPVFACPAPSKRHASHWLRLSASVHGSLQGPAFVRTDKDMLCMAEDWLVVSLRVVSKGSYNTPCS